jgi:hypothetical protein
MPTNDSLRETLTYFRQQREKKLQEAKAFDVTIQQLERELGEAPNGAEIVLNPADSLLPMTDRVEVATNGKKPEIRADEFFGMTQAEASRKYLKRVGHAVSFEDLVNALHAGGCKVGGENPKRVLYISLVRNTRDFVPPQQGYIGLREFYPGIARAPKDKPENAVRKRGRPPKVRSGKRRGRPPKAKREKSSGIRPEPTDTPSPLAEAVRSVLNDKQPHSVDEIAAGVSTKLGHSVKKIGIFGVLRKRESFQKADGGYRLVK